MGLKMKRRNDFFLTSKFVLLFVFVVALGSIVGYAMARNIFAIVVFCLIGFITSFFSKNMIIVLLLPIVGTAIIQACSIPYSRLEGFGEEDDEEEEDEGDEGKEDKKERKKENKLTPEQQVVNIYKESMEKLTNMSDPDQQGEQMKEILKKMLK